MTTSANDLWRRVGVRSYLQNYKIIIFSCLLLNSSMTEGTNPSIVIWIHIFLRFRIVRVRSAFLYTRAAIFEAAYVEIIEKKQPIVSVADRYAIFFYHF